MTDRVPPPSSPARTAGRLAAAAGLFACLAVAGADPATAPSTRPASPSTGPATQAAAATQPADADVAGLIRKLGADEPADRAAAQQELVELGTTATDALRAAADHDGDPEVRSRSAAALAEIRDRDANGPTLVTVDARDADVRQTLDAIGKQAHADIVAAFPGAIGLGKPGQKLTVMADRQPFWDVMADVCGQLNVCPLMDAPNHSTLRLFPTPRNWIAHGPHQVVGPFWVGVSGLYRQSSVDLSGPPVTDDLFLARLIVFPEPKLIVTQMSPLVVREAVDDAGNSLVAPVQPAGRFMARSVARLPARTIEARLRYPEHPGHKIATLAGDLTVTLAQGSQRFEADDVAGGHPAVTRPLPGVKVRVAVTHPGSAAMYQVTVECVRDGLADPQWYAMTNRVNDLSVEDAAGHALTPWGWNPDSSNTDSTFKATGLFGRQPMNNMLMNRMAAVGGPAAAAAPPPTGEPQRVVWNVAARFKVVTVPVAFHDLPMP